MPHKFNAARRHKFDKVQYRVINWAEYNDRGMHFTPYYPISCGWLVRLPRTCWTISE